MTARLPNYNAAGVLDPNSADPFKAKNIALAVLLSRMMGTFFGRRRRGILRRRLRRHFWRALGRQVGRVIHAKDQLR